jgi:hypothetical protein
MRAAAADVSPPAPVYLALLGSYALSAMLLVFGLIGFLTWAAIGDSAGVGATILGLLIAAATYVAWRRSRAGRVIIAFFAAVGAVVGVVYAFTGPGSAVIPSLVIAALGAGTLALLFVPEASKRFYSS